MIWQGAPRGTTAGHELVELFSAAAERFAVSVAGCDMRAPVPTCPTWSTYDLVCHLGNTHAWAATIVETGAPAAEQNDEPGSRKPRAVSEWYAGKAEDLYEVLRGCDPQSPCWNFAYGAGVAGFWQRRQLHETTVHQLDLDTVSGHAPDLDPELCADGVDEVLTVFLHRMHRRGHPATLTAPLSLIATDAGRAWTLSPRAERGGSALPAQVPGSSAGAARGPTGPPLVAERLHPAADRIEAPADVLYRVLWKRLPADDPAVVVHGDTGRVAAFLRSRLVP